MAFRITLGQYYPSNSIVHRLDPRAKIIAALLVMVAVFFINNPIQLLLGWAAAIGATVLCRVPVSKVLSAVKPVVYMLCILAFFNLLLIRQGAVLLSFGPITITEGGVWGAILYSLRLVIGVVAAALLLLTTTPTALTDACDAGLAPLARFGFPAHQLAMIFSLMLRFIPTIADEASAIIDAQTSRGGALAAGSFVHRVKSIGPVVISLLASSLRHASGLSRALDARCYEGGDTRSPWHPLNWQTKDTIAVLCVAAFVALLIALRFILPFWN